VAGDVLEATGDFKLALDFIGDTDLRQAPRYLKRRSERLDVAAAVVDRLAIPASTNRQPAERPPEEEPELVGTTTSYETGPAGIAPERPSPARTRASIENLQPPVLESSSPGVHPPCLAVSPHRLHVRHPGSLAAHAIVQEFPSDAPDRVSRNSDGRGFDDGAGVWP
jgi:hypothetical protein